MTIKSKMITTALMAAALAVVSMPLIETAYNSAQAAGFSKERRGQRANVRKPGRPMTVRRTRSRTTKPRRVMRRKANRYQQRRRAVARPSRPAVTMPKRVITTKRRPYVRPAVTTPRTVITRKPRPYVRPAVTTPKTVINARPRPYARPAVTTPKTVIGGNTQVDPTTGRINARNNAANQAKYQKCATFSMRVQQACYSQSNGDPQMQKSCRTHYQSNVVRCQGLL
jgi:hypothetical protein